MKILIWGTGNYAEYFLNKTECIDEIYGFISNSQPNGDFESKYLQNKKLYRSSDIDNISFDIIIVAVLSEVYMQEIYNECLNLNLDMGKIVFLPRLLDFRDVQSLNDAEKIIYSMFQRNFTLPICFFDFINHWRKYYYINFEEIPKKISLLVENLDDESKRIVDLLLERNFKLFPLPEYKGLFLWDLQRLMNENEQKLLDSNKNWEIEARKQYKIPANLPLEFSVFHYDCGLSFVPPASLDLLQGKDFIDGGAFWGDSALVLNKYSPFNIHCFEPFSRNYEKLISSIKKRKLSNIVPVKMGLGDSISQDVEYYYSDASNDKDQVISTASCLTYADSQFEVNRSFINVTTIDEYVMKNQLNVGLIKLDVEGQELGTIQGALETIKAFRPILLISIYHTPEDLFEIKPIIESLNVGYKFLIRHLTYWPNTEVMLIAY